MSRLRRESGAGMISTTSSTQASPEARRLPVDCVPKTELMDKDEGLIDQAKEKKFSWDPGSKIVNW